MAEKNDSLALDLDLFDNTKNGYIPVEKERKRIQTPKLLEPKTKTKAQVENEVKASRVAAAKACAVALVMLVVLGSLIFSRVQLSEKQAVLKQANTELSTSQSENIRLQMQFNSMMSMDKVEEYAQSKLGMVKRESYQISYFDISSSDGAILTKSGKIK